MELLPNNYKQLHHIWTLLTLNILCLKCISLFINKIGAINMFDYRPHKNRFLWSSYARLVFPNTQNRSTFESLKNRTQGNFIKWLLSKKQLPTGTWDVLEAKPWHTLIPPLPHLAYLQGDLLRQRMLLSISRTRLVVCIYVIKITLGFV